MEVDISLGRVLATVGLVIRFEKGGRIDEEAGPLDLARQLVSLQDPVTVLLVEVVDREELGALLDADALELGRKDDRRLASAEA